MPPLSAYRLGPVGNLIQLPLPGNGIDATAEKVGGSHQLLSGGQSFDVMGVRRSYKMTWTRLDPADQATLEALYLGAYGPGPYVLHDPTRVNMLSVNQSTATDPRGDTTGFAANTTSVISSSLLAPRTGLRSLLVDIPDGTVAGSGGVAATYGTYGTVASPSLDIPVVPGVTYTGSVYAQMAAGGASFAVLSIIWWYTAAGAYLSASYSFSTTVTNATPVRIPVVAAAPAGAHLARLLFTNNATVPAAHPGIHLTDWQVEQAAAASTWVVGSGVPRVHFAALTDNYPKSGQHNMEATLLAVA